MEYLPGEGKQADAPAQEPPAKLEYMAALYGWTAHVHEEVHRLAEEAAHVDKTLDEALKELEMFVPEDRRAGALERAATRAAVMIESPLNPLPAVPEELKP